MAVNNSLADAFDKLLNLLTTNLAILGLPVEFNKENHIQIPNMMFNTPKDFPWIRITNIPVGRIRTDANNCYETNASFFTISLFWPKGVGNDDVTRICEEIKKLYHNYEIDDVVVDRADLLLVNEPSNSPWFGMKVEIYFTYEGYTT